MKHQTSEMLLADKYLYVVHDRGRRGLPLTRVYRNMRRPSLFLKAYAKIYANEGATTTGTDPTDTIQGMSLERIDKIIEQLRRGTYQWKPSRRMYIPKSNGSMRPLSIPNWTDKLVQEVIRIILEAYYEPLFRDSSHGFRPNRSCHTALKQIKHTWKGTKWFIEGDIKGCFDNIDHDILIEILGRRIQDGRFLKLIRSMLQAGYIDDWRYRHSYSGTPQGGIVSPLLANIVLHEMDCHIEDILIPQYTRGKIRNYNPQYSALAKKKQKAKREGNRALYKQLSQQQRLLPQNDPQDPYYRRLRYVRYADDFVLGFTGPLDEAKAIKMQVGQLLGRLNLKLSQEKTCITQACKEPARFLGYEIRTAWNDTKLIKHRKRGKYRSINGTIQLHVPRTIRAKWISRYTKKGKPQAIFGYTDLSDHEIVATFGAQLRGLINYYILAVNIGTALRYIRWIGMESARKTLSAKHQTRQSRVTHMRYYHEGESPNEWRHIRVTTERKGKPPIIAKCGETPLRTQKTAFHTDKLPPKVIAGTLSELLTRLLKGECELCGHTAHLEAHHVNKLKNLRKRWQGRKEKPQWVQNMIARNRKTIVVCRTCHQRITLGKYDGGRIE